LGLTGTHERIPKVLRYVKLNHLCHDPLLDRVNLCGRTASNSKCKRQTIRKRLKRQKKKSGKLPVDLVKLAEIAISPVLGKCLAEFEVAFTNP
jgi:hypothetical protein